MKNIDIAIIGAGPAGLAAGQYCARAGLHCVIFDGAMSGGQSLLIETLDNYPGILSINGFDFAQIMEQQAKDFGVEFVLGMVESVTQRDKNMLFNYAVVTHTRRMLLLLLLELVMLS